MQLVFYIRVTQQQSCGGVGVCMCWGSGGGCRSPWGCGGQALVIHNQIGALILEDLAFPLRHNNALCAELPVSQAWEEGTGRLSHGSHHFLPPSPSKTPSSCKLQTVLCPSEGKDDCTFSITAGCWCYFKTQVGKVVHRHKHKL